MTTTTVMKPDDITIENFQSLLPKGRNLSVTQDVIDQINDVLADEEARETFKENLLTYTSVLAEGRYKLDKYVSAVKYVSYKAYGHSNVVAYQMTFPEKFADWTKRKLPQTTTSSYIRAFHTSKLVQSIMGQAMIPAHILNMHHFQAAINTQAEIMADETVSAKVRSDAANSLLTHLKAPETKKIELDIDVGQNSAISELREVTEKLVQQQRQALSSGSMNAKQLALSEIVTKEK